MAFKVMADNGVDISASQDGAMYNEAMHGQSYIIGALGDAMAMTYTGLNVTVGTGEAIIHGRHVTSKENNSITLPKNTSGYLVLRIDLTRPIGEEAYLFATPEIKEEEINWNGTIYDFVLAEFKTNNITITEFFDYRRTSSGVGEIFEAYLRESRTLQSGNKEILCSLPLTEGVYVITAHVRVTPTTATYVTCAISQSTIANMPIHFRGYFPVGSNQEFTFSDIVKVNKADFYEDFKLMIYSSQNGTTVVNGGVRTTGLSAVRIA